MINKQMPPGELAPLDFREGDVFFRDGRSETTHWSIPWADLMMTMFIFFAIMYIYQSPSRDVLSNKEKEPTIGTRTEFDAEMTIVKPGEFAETLNKSISDIYDLSRETVKSNALEDFATVELIPDKAVRIILAGDLLFDTGKADLKPEAKRSLERIVGIIRQAPYMVNVVGHTDNVPIHTERFPSNWELSAIRACEVVRFLVDEIGIPERRCYISGHSYHQPVFPPDSALSRAANRRVEIIITKERPYGHNSRTASYGRPGSGEAGSGPSL